MFGVRVQVPRQLTHVVTTVSQKRHLLVGLHALRLEHLEQPPFGFAIVGLHEAVAFGGAVGRHALAGDDFEPAVPPGASRRDPGCTLPRMTRANAWIASAMPTSSR